jgi:hypothetical protein
VISPIELMQPPELRPSWETRAKADGGAVSSSRISSPS